MQYTFKSNIKCGGCIATVTPFIEAETRIQHWEVDLEHPDRILTVVSQEMTSTDIIKLLDQAGFEAQELKKNFIGRLFSR